MPSSVIHTPKPIASSSRSSTMHYALFSRLTFIDTGPRVGYLILVLFSRYVIVLYVRAYPSCIRQIFSFLIVLEREREREKYLISNRERNRWQMIRNIANCQVLLKKREQSGTSIGRTLQSARLIARFIPFRPL